MHSFLQLTFYISGIFPLLVLGDARILRNKIIVSQNELTIRKYQSPLLLERRFVFLLFRWERSETTLRPQLIATILPTSPIYTLTFGTKIWLYFWGFANPSTFWFCPQKKEKDLVVPYRHLLSFEMTIDKVMILSVLIKTILLKCDFIKV